MGQTFQRFEALGRVGQDPEVHTTTNGTQITRFSIATEWGHKDKEGKWVETTDWHRLSIFGKRGEIAAKFIRKGQLIFVEGRYNHSEYTDKDGQKKRNAEVAVSDFKMLGRGSTKPTPDGESPAVPEPTEDDIPF